MKKYYFHSLLTIGFVLITHFLIAQNSVILTSGAGVWKPPPGVKSFYVQLWGGGAGGNAEWAQGQFGYNGTGGGGGSSFSQSIVYIVTAAKQASGYGYKVGVGGALNQDGTNSFFENCFAIEGYRSGLERRKSPIAGEVAVSNFGGIGGQSWRNIFDNRWQGGGGGSGRTNGEAAGGQTAGDGFHGYGGDGAGGGGKTGDYAAGAPGGGGSGDQAGARGEIRIFYTCDYTPGTIGNAHTVPYLPELPAGTDFITNVTSPTGFGYTYSWESSTDNVIWTILPGANQITLPIPAIQSNTYFRRVINGCGTNNTSNSVLIKVFSQGNGKKNGVISGKVTSKNGITAVPGVTITVQKTVSLKGSPQSFPYTKVTESDGTYTINPIFYGDNSIEGGDPDNVSFTIIASKAGHKLSTRNPVTLSNIIPTSTGNNFIDSTVYSITGRVTQTCDGCLFGSRGPYGVGNVKISSNDQTVTAVYSDSLRADSIGYFGITVADPQSYTFTAAFLNHKFVPPSQSFTITNDTSNINFSDTSTRLISGKLTDMAGKRIGSAIIKFVGILQRKDSTIVTTFQDTANINTGDSSYSVRLPTGTYKVTIDAFTPAYPSNDARYIPQSDVTDFFNVRVIEPLIDISTKDSVRNLVYHRTPVFVINGLKDTACNIDQNKNPGIVFRTNAPKQFQVYVFEGPPSLGNRMQVTSGNNQPDTLSDYIRFYTSITQRSSIANADTIFFRLKNAFTGPMIDSFFIPGAPNTIAPFTKPFEVHYTDRYGRKATSFKPKTTVVGVFNPTQTFTTAFPEIPFLILHAPPGDQSYSFWSKDSSTALTKSWSVGSDKGNDAFVNVSLGGTIGLSEGPVSIDVQVIATGNYTHENHVNSGLTDEIESTVTTNQKFQTSKSLRVTGNSGDVYIGNGTNYKLGNSIYVDFKQGTPVGACEIEKDVKLIIGVDTFRTEFAYAEDHIVNVIIPQQDRVSREATDPVKRAEAANQVKVWQQVIDNNKINKKIAGSSRNRSFSHGVIIEESETNSKSATNTITYDVLLGNNFAYELGLRVANVGVSGGGMITMRETWGNSTINMCSFMGVALFYDIPALSFY